MAKVIKCLSKLCGVVLTGLSEVLKQPLETAVAIHTEDFEDFHMQEDMHVVISVKDFKAIVTHAETLRGPISAHFSFPTRPLQFCYQNFGMHCEFTLMTTGDLRGASSTPNPNFISTRSGSRQPSVAPTISSNRNNSEMPPPARPVISKPPHSQDQQRTLKGRLQQPVPQSDPDSDSLFMPNGDDDQTWGPKDFEHEEEEEMLGWDASADHSSASFHPTFRNSGKGRPKQQEESTSDFSSQQGLEPTQRLSQVSRAFKRPGNQRLTLVAARNVRLRSMSYAVRSFTFGLLFSFDEAGSTASEDLGRSPSDFDLIPA